MYYATKRTDNTKRAIGLGAVVVINALLFWALATGRLGGVINQITETEVAIIEVPEIEEEEPPPPPPVDVELPPPPPTVILPDFVFDAPSENAIRNVEIAKDPPRPADVRPAPPRPKLPPVKPVANKERFAQMMVEDYPPRALRAKQEGDVTVSMCVSIDGRASDVKLVRGSVVESLDEATVKGIAKLRFTPAKDENGKNTAWCNPPYQLTVSWKLPKD
jgi:protein TonB